MKDFLHFLLKLINKIIKITLSVRLFFLNFGGNYCKYPTKKIIIDYFNLKHIFPERSFLTHTIAFFLAWFILLALSFLPLFLFEYIPNFISEFYSSFPTVVLCEIAAASLGYTYICEAPLFQFPFPRLIPGLNFLLWVHF